MPDGLVAAGYHGFYWLALVLVFAFLVILPTGEHFHIVTALPALYFRRGRPANVVPFVDLERAMADETGTVAVGARSARDLTWKEGLDAFTCTECGRCKDACPTFLTGKPLSLKWVNDAVKHHLADMRAPLVAGAPDDAFPARRTHSPVDVSRAPSTATLTPAARMTRANAAAIFCPRASNDSAEPT